MFEIARRSPPTQARKREGYGRRSSGSLAMFAAIRRASSLGHEVALRRDVDFSRSDRLVQKKPRIARARTGIDRRGLNASVLRCQRPDGGVRFAQGSHTVTQR